MPIISARTLLWIGRILYIAAALWWPAVWRDPIYTPRQARMSGQELRLPDATVPQNDDERAVAIFWAWEHRQLVETRWVAGPCIGLRSGLYGGNRTGLQQTILVLVSIWLLFGVLLARRGESAARQEGLSASSSKGGFGALALTPLWQLFQRLR